MLAVLISMAHTAVAQEAFKTNLSVAPGPKPWSVALYQVATGLNIDRPAHLQPVVGVVRSFEGPWLAAISYDFASLAIEGAYRSSQLDDDFVWGASLALVPELRSFSWKLSPYVGYNLGRCQLSAVVGLASLNAWGLGLWSLEFDSSPTGRAFIVPLQLQAAMRIDQELRLRLAFESQTALGDVALKNKSAVLVGLSQGFE